MIHTNMPRTYTARRFVVSTKLPMSHAIMSSMQYYPEDIVAYAIMSAGRFCIYAVVAYARIYMYSHAHAHEKVSEADTIAWRTQLHLTPTVLVCKIKVKP